MNLNVFLFSDSLIWHFNTFLVAGSFFLSRGHHVVLDEILPCLSALSRWFVSETVNNPRPIPIQTAVFWPFITNLVSLFQFLSVYDTLRLNAIKLFDRLRTAEKPFLPFRASPLY